MKLKDKLGLYVSDVDAPAAEEDIAYMNELLLKAARKSITLVRNVDNILPLNNNTKKKGDFQMKFVNDNFCKEVLQRLVRINSCQPAA